MATEPTLGVLEASAVQDLGPHAPLRGSTIGSLRSPKINLLIAITAAAGLWMGSHRPRSRIFPGCRALASSRESRRKAVIADVRL